MEILDLKVLPIELQKKKLKEKYGEDFLIWLQLKVIADIGIIGFPNAGKSSLLSALTRAKPKIASYPFTTIDPNLGVAYYDDKEFTLADIPGLVEGAHKGVGLGDKFLRHIERNSALLFMIPADSDNINKEYEILRNELKKYDESLNKKKELIVFTKIDLLDKKITEKKLKVFKNKIKSKYDIISVFNSEDIKRIKRNFLKNVSK